MGMRWSLGLAGVVALTMGGCATAPVGARAQSPEPNSSGERDDVATAAADIDPQTSGPLTLAKLLAFAEVNGPALVMAREEASVGDAEVAGAEVLIPYNPEVSISAGPRTSMGLVGFEFAAEVEQRFEIAGQRGARIEAAEHGRDARRARSDVTRWEQHALVHALYYKVLVREAQLAAAGKLARFTDSLQSVVDKRVAAGEESELEAVALRAELARVRGLVIDLQQARRVTELRLTEVVGWPGTVPLRVVGELPAPAAPPPLAGLVRHAVDEHPSKRWLALELRAASARVAREDLQAWPDPSLSFGYARESQLGPPAQHVWLGTLRVPLPIWERNQAGRTVARAEQRVARAELAAFERRVGSRIGAAHARVNAALGRVKLYQAAILPAFEQNLTKLRRAFELGEVDVLQLSQIQQQILEAQRAALLAIEDYFDAVAALEALSGVEVHPHGDSGGAAAP